MLLEYQTALLQGIDWLYLFEIIDLPKRNLLNLNYQYNLMVTK